MKNQGGDIRDKTSLTGEEVIQLNFINDSGKYFFRKHNRQGMRSHVLEVLSTEDLQKETVGEIIDGIRLYPRAMPKYMLRILRNRFRTLEETLDEIKTYNLVLKFLGPECIALSNEFIVEYTLAGKSEIVLCGLQEYVHGAILDPWGLVGKNPLETFYQSRFPSETFDPTRTEKGRDSIATFVTRMRKMITESGYVTDLAGNGNLILTSSGDVKLVDINNIIQVSKDDTILLDDKGYPSCDKSIEVLWILEDKILKTANLSDDSLYSHFLSVQRLKKVRILEQEFFKSLSS
ncbi:hypothetical protein [Desulforhopalus sp. IMCC35007]|uniref:hypothetical protein n=1 Tax=Desulforhopalus sp. IMCC35007 TaxID=2569543 RepID=UPI0010ADB27B|nr:hypothetical protein [Desulforhopalus sp. IMCC35007]TKB06769.1 hypothetical protein FCL48_19390 [Desulforhopalus sp. IMCC35007]